MPILFIAIKPNVSRVLESLHLQTFSSLDTKMIQYFTNAHTLINVSIYNSPPSILLFSAGLTTMELTLPALVIGSPRCRNSDRLDPILLHSSARAGAGGRAGLLGWSTGAEGGSWPGYRRALWYSRASNGGPQGSLSRRRALLGLSPG